jgi:hypothetical protein
VRWSYARTPVRFRLDGRLELAASPCALLLQVGSDGSQFVIVDALGEELAVCEAALEGVCSERLLARMEREERVVAFTAQGSAAPPGIAGRVVDHARAKRVQVDVAYAAQHAGPMRRASCRSMAIWNCVEV